MSNKVSLNMLDDAREAADDEFDRLDAAVAAAEKRFADEHEAHAETQRRLQAALAEAEAWKKKCETMADHPDVIAAALKRSEENLRAAQANHDRARARLNRQP